MAISQEFAQKLSEGGGSKYFALKNDKDFAIVRLMYNSIDELAEDIYAVHYTDDGKFECKRKNFSDPISVCPLCQSGNKSKAVVFIKMYNTETKEAVVWEKSYTWYKNNLESQIVELLSENSGRNICEFPIKIVRNGAAGDMKTAYNLFCKAPDGTTLESLGEKVATPLKESDNNAPVPESNVSSGSEDLFRGM